MGLFLFFLNNLSKMPMEMSATSYIITEQLSCNNPEIVVLFIVFTCVSA